MLRVESERITNSRSRQYAEAIDSIHRAARAKVLPTIDLAWPATAAERIYDSVPTFQPRVFAAWAEKHYPKTAPQVSSERLLGTIERPSPLKARDSGSTEVD